MKKELLTKVEDSLDPLQLTYRARRGVEDAKDTLSNLVLRHLEGTKTHARILLVDISSAFNTIQPHILVEKLLSFGFDFSIVGLILDFLTDCIQRVKVMVVDQSYCIHPQGPLRDVCFLHSCICCIPMIAEAGMTTDLL